MVGGLMRIWIAQCLCPSRHCLMASVSRDESSGPEEAMQKVRAGVRAGLSGGDYKLGAPPMNPWCGLCGATNDTWIFEVRRSKEFATPEAAVAEIADLVQKQVESKRILDELGFSYDAQHKRKPN
jgi:hypothetical protein